MIEGDHISRIGDILDIFGYHDANNDNIVRNWHDLLKAISWWQLGKNRVLKAVFYSNGHTIIFDPEMVHR
jgi:hypothetical protein